jgi:hypothetical protein
MMTPAECLATVRDQIAEALKADDLRTCRMLLIQPHTIATLGALYTGRAEASARFEAAAEAAPFPQPEAMQ